MPPLSSATTMKRLHKEVADIKKEDLGGMTLAPANDNLFLWRGSIPGPEGSPYEGGVYDLEVQLQSDYPFSAPRARFLTRIYHMNINDQGGICIDILKQNWSPALSLWKVLLSLSSLLTDPNPRDPLVPAIATQFLRDRKAHDDTARDWTRRYARRAEPIPVPVPVIAPAPPPVAPLRTTAAGPSSATSRASGAGRGVSGAIVLSDSEGEGEGQSAAAAAAPLTPTRRRKRKHGEGEGEAAALPTRRSKRHNAGAASGANANLNGLGEGEGISGGAGPSTSRPSGEVIEIPDSPVAPTTRPSSRGGRGPGSRGGGRGRRGRGTAALAAAADVSATGEVIVIE